MNSRRNFSEFVGRGLLFLLLAGLILLVVGFPRGGQPAVEIHARMPENGGWTPGDLTIRVGEPLHLRLVSDDVVHGFAIGQSDRPPVDLMPGKPVETTLIFDAPGKYTYYCTRWCGMNHWRMRGTIQVLPSQDHAWNAIPVGTTKPPLYVVLGLDIDAPHLADVTPQVKPSAARGESLVEKAPAGYAGQDYLRTHSPADVWKTLRQEPSLQGLDDGQLWDLVASLWQANTTPERLVLGKELFARNCAACHGENGAGDGVMADELKRESGAGDSMEGMEGHRLQAPADFTDPQKMLGASPAVLHGKIVRGGMGTGMPYWGPILTDDQIWALVEYLWTFYIVSSLDK